MNIMKKYIKVLSGILIGCIVATPLLGDDTDIYIAGSPTSGNSNVLISIDTSGSMLQHVINFDAIKQGGTSSLPNHPKYNPNVTYSGNCISNSVYLLKNHGNAPWDSPMIPYVRVFPNQENSADNGWVQFFCIKDVRPDWDAGLARRDSPTAGWYRTTRNSFVVSDVSCNVASASFTNWGFFRDELNECSETPYTQNSLYLTGNFINFVNSITNNQGVPNVGWDNFFTQSRLQIVKQVVRDLIDNNEKYNINIGLARFRNTNTQGGLIAEAIQPIIDAKGNHIVATQNQLKATLDEFDNWNSTPLEETYYEASLYFRGATPQFGGASNANALNGDGSKYKSPITHTCQKNSIITLSDGDPSNDEDADDLIQSIWNTNRPNMDYVNNGETVVGNSQADNDCNGSGTCMDELAQYMDEIDLQPDDTLLTGPNGFKPPKDLGIKQTVQTHTIGFLNGNAILADTARAGSGIARLANNADDLKAIFAEALGEVIDETSSFTAPSLTANSFNRLTNQDDLYFTLFKPNIAPIWKGNLKKYKFKDGVIVDQDGNPAKSNC